MPNALRAVGPWVVARLQRARVALAAWPWAELAAALALLAGWTLLTWGVAALTVWQVWPISAGLFLVSLFGWRFFYTMARDGLYALTREKK